MSTSDDYLYDRSGAEDPEVARLEALLSPLAHDRPLDELRLRRGGRSRAPWIAGAVAMIAAAAVLALVLRGAPVGSGAAACGGDLGFRFTARGDTVACDGARLAAGVLPVGGVLETGAAAAELAIAEIGTAQLAPGTRVRLDRSTADRQQLHLEHGRMEAVVNAPPRIFAVTTPSTDVVDLGCAYAIEIDAKGRGTIAVTSGSVELASADDIKIVAPAGTTTRLLEGRRPGLPVAATAGAAVRAAVAALERGLPQAVWDASQDPVTRLLAAATPGDAITVVNFAVVAAAPRRRTALARLAELSPPPDGVTIDSALASPADFERWRQEVVLPYLEESLLQDRTNKLRRD